MEYFETVFNYVKATATAKGPDPNHWHNLATSTDILFQHLDSIGMLGALHKDVIAQSTQLLQADFDKADFNQVINYGNKVGVHLSDALLKRTLAVPNWERNFRLQYVKSTGELKVGGDYLVRQIHLKGKFEQARLENKPQIIQVQDCVDNSCCMDSNSSQSSSYQMTVLGGVIGMIGFAWGSVFLPGILPATVVCPVCVGAAVGLTLLGSLIVVVATPEPQITCFTNAQGNLECH